MASPRGCFKTGCLGCLGLLALLILITGVTALLAWNDSKTTDLRDEVLTPMEADEGFLVTGHPGRVVLNLAQAEFWIQPSAPGEGLRIEAVYDEQNFDLKQEFTTLPDSTWQYELDFRRTSSGMRAILQSIFSKGPSTQVKIYLPPEVPVELVAEISKGGLDGEFGGLWLTSADLRVHQGGFALGIHEPLKQPMTSFRIRSSQGGFEASELGNASPQKLDISCSMGGAEIDLSGAWQNDCNVNLAVKMGGLVAIVPDDVRLVRGAEESPTLTESDPEGAKPELRIRSSARYGEIDIIH